MADSRRVRQLSVPKLWAFRALTVSLALTPFLVAELLLHATPYGIPSEGEDPYVGFDDVHPLFVLDGDQQRFVTDPGRQSYFRADSFAAEKPADEYRIFCLGGSTVQGRPYAIETAFSTWLELSLQAADPAQDWRVVNCGGVSYASYRLVPILRELVNHQPDLFVIYTGHNEFLEDRTFRAIKETPAAITTLHSHFSQLRLYNLSRSSWVRLRGTAPKPLTVLPTEVDALLDHFGGLADYERDDAWRVTATEHYRYNLQVMLQIARAAGVPVILVNPAMNLRDCPPFKHAPSESLSADDQARFEALWESAVHRDGLSERIELLEKAVALDRRNAAAQFFLAKSYDAAGRWDLARETYLKAKEEDICPLRMIESQYAVLAEVARQTRTLIVDARQFFESRSRVGIPGDDWLLDHVHPSINGHQEIAGLILDAMAKMGIVNLRGDWKKLRADRFSNHLDALPSAYFVHGTQRLEGLLLWTKGRAEGGGSRRSDRRAGGRAARGRGTPNP